MQYLYQLDSQRKLVKNDFSLFSESFTQAVAEFIPIFEELVFIHDGADAARHLHSRAAREQSRGFWKNNHEAGGFIRCHEQQILFTLPAQTKTLAVVSGVDSYFVRHVSADWLEEFHGDIIERFRSTVDAEVDMETGLLTGRRFLDDLRENIGSPPVTILLIELYPRARSARASEMHTAKSVHALRRSFPESLPLYSLRHHLYAAILKRASKKQTHALVRKILSRLRMEGFPRIHVGMRCEMEVFGEENRHAGLEIFDQVRLALETARKRGPYAFCDYEHILYPRNHPLRRPAQKVMASFRRKYHLVERFCVILFQANESTVTAKVRRLLNEAMTLEDDEDIYVFLANMDCEQAREWAADRIAQLEGEDVRAGIACYPYAHFGKSQTVFNSRKALRHADFYGPGGLAVFSALSLNVSGDIYYEEGDLTAAVKEFKAGLACDPEDTNLLNSLGVCYVDMGRHALARRCFEEVLRLDGSDFMALVNAGLESLRQQKHIEAIDYFESAYALQSRSSEEKDDREDLPFQLGRLYCLTGNYSKAVAILETLIFGREQPFFQEKALAYLGRSYYGLERYDLAAQWLQKALNYNEFDAETMGLLGYVYLLRGEGREIALSLCTKSVELSPGNGRLRLYLAAVLIFCGQYAEARERLGRCLRNRNLRQEASLLLCEIYLKEGRPTLARRRLDIFEKNTAVDEKMRYRLKKLYEELNGADRQKRQKKSGPRAEI